MSKDKVLSNGSKSAPGKAAALCRDCLRTGVLLTALLGLSSCAPVTSLRNTIKPPVSWEFIQSTGGLRLGQPHVVEGIFWLPLTMDLSGQQAITVAPTAMNTGRKCIRASLRQGDFLTTPVGYYNLYLEIYDGPTAKQQEGGCDEVPLFVGDLSPPLARPESVTFKIWYKDFLFSKQLVAELKL